MIDYIGLYIVLRNKGKNIKYLHQKLGLSKDTVAKFKRGDSISLSTIERICIELDCRIEEIVEIKKDRT